jgi:SAM-dependent methyltransferase
MIEPSAWQRFFDSQAETYEQNGFTQHTVAEVGFFLSLFPLSRGDSVLDVGCGTGRHSIELARRGFQVTGVDQSEGMLAVARRNAAAVGVQLEFVLADARAWSSLQPFDSAICLCEGGMGLIEAGESAEAHDSAILTNLAKSLKPGAPFLLTCLNGYSTIRQMKDEHIADGRFDPSTMYANYQDEWDLPSGTTLVTIRERLFIAPEVVAMLTRCGFRVENVYGGTAGYWARRFLSLDEVEAMFVCRRA